MYAHKFKPQTIQLPLLFYVSIAAAAILCLFCATVSLLPGADEIKVDTDEITIITTEGCPGCITLKNEWRNNRPLRERLRKKANIRFVQIESVPAGVNRKGEVIQLGNLAQVDELLSKE